MTKNITTDEAPTLIATRTGNGQEVRVWCPYCRPHRRGKPGDWHYHGAAGARGWLGHRGAHCLTSSGSPLIATGYNLIIPGEVEDDG